MRKFSRLLPLLLLAAGMTDAGELYHWVDDDGIAHYSQLPPDEPVASVEVRELPEPDADYDPAADAYSVLNQAERIHAAWSQLREEREARREERRKSEPAPPQRYEYAAEAYGYRYGTYYPPVHPPVRPPRPPLRPGHGIRRHQYRKLDELGLWDEPRAHSINSTAHRQRVETSSRTVLP